jgi:acyl dehydratase
MKNLEVGQKFSWERTFTAKDVEMFAELSGDKGMHHVQPDDEGRIMVHGLLTGTVPTKIGGDLNYIAREITTEFLRPVFVGDTVRAEVTITQADSSTEGYMQVAMDIVCYNQHGKQVMVGKSRGIISNR